MENFVKTAYVIGKLRKKYVVEIARFGARAPRAGAVDVKRLIYLMNIIVSYVFGVLD